MQANGINKSVVAALALAAMMTGPAAFGQPASGIDPMIVRLNGGSAIAEDVIPFVWDQQGFGAVDMGQVNLLDRNATACLDFGDVFGAFFDPLGRLCVGVRVRSHLRSVSIDLPMDEDTLAASFLAATAPAGRAQTAIDMPGAALDTVMRVRVNLVAELPSFVPANIADDVEDFFTIQDDFAIGMDGLDLTVRATVARSGNSLSVTALEQFTPTIGAVAFTDSSGLVAIANFVSVSINQFFGLPGSGTVNSFARTLVNNTIRDNAEIRNMVQDSINDALRAAGRSLGNSTSLPNTDLIALSVGIGMNSFATRVNDLRSDWNMTVTATGTTIVLPFAYSYLARTAQNINTIATSGDLQAFLPLTMFDKVGFELARKGWFHRTITIPANAATPSFNVVVTPTGTPRAQSVAGSAQQIRWTLPIALANAPGAPAGSPTLTGVTASMSVVINLNVDNRNGLTASVASIALTNLAGTLQVGNTTVNLAAIQGLIQTAIRNALSGALPVVTLVPKVTNIMQPFAISLGTISVGSQYVNVPLTLVNNG